MLRFFRRTADPLEELRRELGDVEIPSFSRTITRLLPMLRNEDTQATEIGEVLQHDPALHVLVLRTVNSAAHGLSSKVDSIGRAVTLLGRARLESVVLSVAVRKTLPGAGAGFDTDSFWRTAARRATVARALALLLHRETEARSFTAGLLQDIAVPLLVAAKGDRYREVYERWRADPGASLPALEKEALGYDHQEVGAMIATHWQLPGDLVNAVGAHHGQEAEDAAEPAVALVANLRDSTASDGADTVVRECETRFGIDRAHGEALVSDAFRVAEEFAGALV